MDYIQKSVKKFGRRKVVDFNQESGLKRCLRLVDLTALGNYTIFLKFMQCFL